MTDKLAQHILLRKVRPVHPEEMISDIILDGGLTPEIYANGNFILQEILEGKRPMSISFAEQLGKQFDISTELLMRIQRKVDIWDSKSDRIGSNEYEV